MRSLPDTTLLQLSDFIAANLALHFPKERWNELERNIISASHEFGYKNVAGFIQRIISSPITREHIEILTAHLTNNETFFWREHDAFNALEQKILPDLMSSRQGERRIRIWSAGCSTGEEPYSIAMALHRAIPIISDWNITILASDISARIIKKAKIGLYSQWSFRNAPEWLQEKYFISRENKKFEITSEIKNMVKYEYLNLAEDVYPSTINNTNGMDIIFCRNVLMYFTQNRINYVLHGLYNSLVDGGYLVVSASELSLLNTPGFIAVNLPGIVIYQKASHKRFILPQSHLKEYDNVPYLSGLALEPVPVCKVNETPVRIVEKEIVKIEKSSTQLVSVYEEALLVYSQGNYADVINTLQKGNQTLEEQLLLIRAYANIGNLADALKICEKAVFANKLNPRLHYLQALILQENNQLVEAAASLRNAIFLDPNFVLSYYTLGNLYQRLGNDKNAKKCNEAALSILAKLSSQDTLPESEGLTVGRLKEIVNASVKAGE